MPQLIDATIRVQLSLPSSVSLDDLDARLPELLAEGFAEQLVVSQELPRLLSAMDVVSKQFHRSFPLNEMLAENDQVAIIWNTEDVIAVRPDLTDDQAWEVLRHAKHNHDASLGLNWTALHEAATALFGRGSE